MRKVEKLVLNQLAKKELTQRQQAMIKGGRGCHCGCCYAGSGGSSSTQNGLANCADGLRSPCGDEVNIWGC